MTQIPGPHSVMGKFDGTPVEFKAYNQTYVPRQHSNSWWIEMGEHANLRFAKDSPRTEFPVVLLTGSHHFQAYWFPLGTSSTLRLFPIIYLKHDQRWVPGDSVFLKPPVDTIRLDGTMWNQQCIQCHATHGQSNPVPNSKPPVFESRVAQFGIACEACHGPGEEHIALHRASGSSPPAKGLDPIVNPAALSPSRSAQVCGQCHGITLLRDNRLAWEGFRPGDDLFEWRHLMRPDKATEAHITKLQGGIKPDPRSLQEEFDGLFWSDGTVRVSGREYNGLVNSPCHQSGDMSCLSCHGLHQHKDDGRPAKEWANDQLQADKTGDAGCTQCHKDERFRSSAHTHHLPGSEGSRCYNCHMPFSTYGLMKGIRNHTISSPDVANELSTGRPNACNLCHLDKSLEWTVVHLEDWFKIKRPELTTEQKTIAASILHTTRGEAGQRALLAWHFGWGPAQDVSGRDWIPLFLAGLMTDPYDAVRYIAARSLHSLEGYERIPFDFVGTAQSRSDSIRAVMETWRARSTNSPSRTNSHVVIDRETVGKLLEQRDNRPIRLME